MYIYKKTKDKFALTAFVDTDDMFEVEETIIKLMRKDIHLKFVTKVKTQFTGIYTVYSFGAEYEFVASAKMLNPNGTIK